MIPVWKIFTLYIIYSFIGTTATFEITSETDIDSLFWPVQSSNPENPYSFFRIYQENNRIEEIFCPDRTVFDTIQLKCVQTKVDTRTKTTTVDGINDYCNGTSGTIPYPDDCRQFINCGEGYAYLEECKWNLLFNAKKGFCDWPLGAHCCEYVEEDSHRIVE